jgi:hypothetical protein
LNQNRDVETKTAQLLVCSAETVAGAIRAAASTAAMLESLIVLLLLLSEGAG